MIRRTTITAKSPAPAIMITQISLPTWLVRTLKVKGWLSTWPSWVMGASRIWWTPAASASILTFTEARCLGSSRTGSGTDTLIQLDPVLALSPTTTGWSRPLTMLTDTGPLPPDKVTKSLPVTVISLSWAPTQSSALPADLRLTRGWVRASYDTAVSAAAVKMRSALLGALNSSESTRARLLPRAAAATLLWDTSVSGS